MANMELRSRAVTEAKKNSMTSIARLEKLYDAVIETKDIEGDIVEAGVWKGGSCVCIIQALNDINVKKDLWLYDTFAGMTKPGENDYKVKSMGNPKSFIDKWERLKKEDGNDWCNGGSLEDVKTRLDYYNRNGLNIKYIKGDVCQAKEFPSKISLLRVDVDFYEPTKAVLENMYDKVAYGGIIIFDDYYCWNGAQKAIDDINKYEIIRIDDSAGYCKKGV